MARSSSGKATSARERARAARLRLDAERARRDEEIEAAATRYFEAVDARDAIERQIEALREKISTTVEVDMGAALRDLASLGETAARQRELLDIDEAERRRLRALGEETATPDDVAPTGTSDVAPAGEAAERVDEQAA
ncbi:hypothetical protein [Cellulosimicrobium cellulans]|uniref:hypothetical protein n=1 Tax=Cellulosimicrobium cellulans TaxID=1710 RepID=UPI0020CF24BC|nr:hypothetical protein NMQ07_19420 [Cellulosimicrobium cellulans]